ncbi:hypothetical protein BJ508DRAFT_329300 [Ascobolus immersus RN42]|uniref:F-box domain-containing protein n=1 Tax=Ascobolus immersus RN42 TaxID=1160509 RepID=A0A3N4I2M9_ASCIM|nr:hypothetical protein BJ508DRAFT_329300 [Ascobolus immersus RN42]
MSASTFSFSDIQPTQPPPFLSLPIELRLYVYGHCSAFTLLQLIHTCHRFSIDLNHHTRIFTAAYGFHAHKLYHQRLALRAATASQQTLQCPFGIWCIRYIPDKTEANLFTRLYESKAYRSDFKVKISMSSIVPPSLSPETPTQTPPPRPRYGSNLFSLPIELRLEIYCYFSAFTLLQLLITHPRLHAEINAHPAIFKNAFGYFPCENDDGHNKQKLSGAMNFPPPWLLPFSDVTLVRDGGFTFNVCCIREFPNWAAYVQFREAYGPFPNCFDLGGGLQIREVCTLCGSLVWTLDSKGRNGTIEIEIEEYEGQRLFNCAACSFTFECHGLDEVGDVVVEKYSF